MPLSQKSIISCVFGAALLLTAVQGAGAAQHLRVLPQFPCELQLLNLADEEPEPDTFYLDVAEDPHRVHKEMERLYARARSQGFETFSFLKARPVVLRIISDLNHRLEAGTVLELPQFKSFHDRLAELRTEAISLVAARFPYTKVNKFIIAWEETMSALMQSADPSLTGTYHRDIAGPELKDLMKQGDGTSIFFTFHDVDDDYFWDVRPAATYLHGLMRIPRFTVTAATYKGGPLVPTDSIRHHIDGYLLFIDEFTKHDAGHSAFMRRDIWLFQNMGYTREEMVRQWVATKRYIKGKLVALRAQDPDLAAAVSITLTEVIHERGYQFYLPILQQQLRTSKWTDVVRKKLLQNYWAHKPLSEGQALRLDEARDWLLGLVNSMAIDSTIGSVGTLMARDQQVMVRHWLPIGTFKGAPEFMTTQGPSTVTVNFSTDTDGAKNTSLYEVSLAQIRTDEEPSLPAEKIDLTQRLTYAKRMNLPVVLKTRPGTFTVSEVRIEKSGHFFVLLQDQQEGKGTLTVPLSDVVVPAEVPATLPDDALFSKVELFKMKQILTLQAQHGSTEFTITPEPEVYRGTVSDINLRKLTIKIRTTEGIKEFLLVETSLHPLM